MNTPQFQFHSFPDKNTLIEELSGKITSCLNEGIIRNGKASLAVSGGSTPIDLFNCLADTEFPWEKVAICLVDERWVNQENPDSNEHLVRTQLLQNKAQKASFIGMKNIAATASEGEEECNRHLERIPFPFDVVLLGMGNDGHTASLFPGATDLPRATDMNSEKLCVAIAPPTAPHERMSLTLPAILQAKQIILHITGHRKRDIFELAMEDGPMDEMPIRYVLKNAAQKQGATHFSIYWAD